MHRFIAVFCCVALGSCSSIPDVNVTYFLPKAETTITVTTSIDCDVGKTELFFSYSATSATAYSSDTTRVAPPISLSGLDSAFSDISLSFNFTDDGRLKGVNTSATGQLPAVIKSAVSLAATVGALGVAGAAPPPPCDVIAKWGGGKPVTINFVQKLGPNSYGNGDVTLTPVAGDQALYGLLEKHLPQLQLHSSRPVAQRRVAETAPNSKTGIALTLTDTASVGLSVIAKTAGKTHEIWTGTAIVPVPTTYQLPIPKPAIFGKETFALSLSDSGAVSSIAYTKGTGAADVLDSGTAVTGAAKPDNAATQAADLKAQADVIAQQQRLVRCKSNPGSCT